MSKFNIGDKVISNEDRYSGKDVGVIVGIDLRKGIPGKYLVKFDSLDEDNRLTYKTFINNPYFSIEPYDIEPYEGGAIWLDDLIKVEKESEGKHEKEKCEEDKHEENIRMEFDEIREQKKEVIKDISEKMLEMNLEIKELEAEIEKIKKEWHLN